MNLVSFIFFGKETELDSIILKKLKVLEFRPAENEYSGLYVVEKKYGQQDIRKIDLSYKAESEGDWLIYRYLSDDELLAIKTNSINKRLYILMHNYYSYDFLMSDPIIKNKENQLLYIVDAANDEFKTSDYVNKRLKTKNIYQLQRIANKKKDEATHSNLKNNFLLYWVGFLVKALLNPAQELSRFVAILRYSKLRIFGRSLELVLFAHFILKKIIFTPLQISIIKIYHFIIWLGGCFKIVLIKLGFLIRHILLMMGFKSFGALIDSTHFAIRLKDFIVKWSYYNFLHRMYYDYVRAFFIKIFELLTKFYFKYLHSAYFKTIHTFYYKVLHKTYFKTIHAFYYKVIHKLYFQIVHRFYHNVVKKILDYIWVNFLSILIFDFIVKRVYYGFIFKIYYSVVFTFYHKVLKKTFTSVFFGFIQPLYYAVIVNFLYYGILHAFYHKVVVKAFVFLKYKLVFSVYYGFFVPSYHSLLNILRYKIRHWILLLYYKTYGFLFDCCTFGYRVFKLYLMYPFFKVYWFTKFQFNKRIKKKITNE